MTASNPGTYTVDQAAALLGVGRDTVYRAIRDHGEIAGIPAIRVSTRLVIPALPLNAALGLTSRQAAARLATTESKAA
jgi:excisionase family DNA binding protein